MLGAALLLLAPVGFASGVTADGALFAVIRTGWQIGAAAYRFFFPALLLHFVVLHLRRPILRSPLLWGTFYLALLAVLAAVTDFFRLPLAWTQLGPERDLRNVVGLVAESLLIAAAVVAQRDTRTFSAPLRWLMYAIVAFSVTAAIRSVFSLSFGEWSGTEFITQLNDLPLILLTTTAAMYFFVPVGTQSGGWRYRRWVTPAVSSILTGLYGVGVVGVAATVLNVTRRDLDGVEWLLFGAIFLATILFAAVPRWARELVDSRMWAGWLRREELAYEFGNHIRSELEPERIGQRVAEELPNLLEAATVRLVIVQEIALAWGLEPTADLSFRPRGVLEQGLAVPGEVTDMTPVPVRRSDGTLLGVLEVGHPFDGHDLDVPEDTLRKILASGVAAALRNTEAYLALRRTEQELAEAERIASMGALAGGLAHEIKNPLAGLKMGLHLLRQGNVDPERLERLESDLRRIDDLVGGLLRFTHGGLGETPERVDLRDLTEACVREMRPLAEDRGVILVERYTEEELPILGGHSQLRLVISNLLGNALDAVHTGGVIEVGTTRGAAGAGLRIQDTGPGIPEEIRDRVFEMNFTTKSAGSGLGLALARRETERLGGTIEMDTAERRGTSLRVVLPLAK